MPKKPEVSDAPKRNPYARVLMNFRFQKVRPKKGKGSYSRKNVDETATKS